MLSRRPPSSAHADRNIPRENVSAKTTRYRIFTSRIDRIPAPTRRGCQCRAVGWRGLPISLDLCTKDRRVTPEPDRWEGRRQELYGLGAETSLCPDRLHWPRSASA